MRVLTSIRFAWYIRTADKKRPGETPVASLKMREKWKRLSMALHAMSLSDSGSPYRSQMHFIARSTALFIGHHFPFRVRDRVTENNAPNRSNATVPCLGRA
jgi:hypothetical protein